MSMLWISVAIVLMLAAAVLIIAGALLQKETGAAIEIIIDADEAGEQLEDVAMSVKMVADKYFKNADIYIRGGDEELVRTVCRAYALTKK